MDNIQWFLVGFSVALVCLLVVLILYWVFEWIYSIGEAIKRIPKKKAKEAEGK